MSCEQCVESFVFARSSKAEVDPNTVPAFGLVTIKNVSSGSRVSEMKAFL